MDDELKYLFNLIDNYYNPPVLKYYSGHNLEKKSLLNFVNNISSKKSIMEIINNEYGLIGNLILKYRNDKKFLKIKEYIFNIELNS